MQHVLLAVADTWIDAGSPTKAHGSDAQLFVDGGALERRALASFVLPALPAGATLVHATLALQLQSNADATLSTRTLAVHRLTQAVSESRATWINYGTGASRKWTLPGGDFGSQLGQTLLPAATASGPVQFQLEQPLASVFGAEPVDLDLIVRELSPAPVAPAELALAAPTLTIEYCSP